MMKTSEETGFKDKSEGRGGHEDLKHRSDRGDFYWIPESLAALQQASLGCKLCFRGEALTRGWRICTLTWPRIMYGWRGTQEPALAFNVGKPAATTVIRAAATASRRFPGNTRHCETEKWRNTQMHTRQKNIPCANFHFVSVFFFYLPGHLFPTHSVQKRFPVLPPFVTPTIFGGSFSS